MILIEVYCIERTLSGAMSSGKRDWNLPIVVHQTPHARQAALLPAVKADRGVLPLHLQACGWAQAPDHSTIDSRVNKQAPDRPGGVAHQIEQTGHHRRRLVGGGQGPQWRGLGPARLEGEEGVPEDLFRCGHKDEAGRID
jgi:hypothetical protein